MKLDSALVEKAANQIPAQAIPDNHPVVPQLNQLFGDHTFFLDDKGLHIVEPADASVDGGEAGQVVKVASWSDPNRTSLSPHEPEPTEVVVSLDAAA